jgi:hypothetical protein
MLKVPLGPALNDRGQLFKPPGQATSGKEAKEGANNRKNDTKSERDHDNFERQGNIEHIVVHRQWILRDDPDQHSLQRLVIWLTNWSQDLLITHQLNNWSLPIAVDSAGNTLEFRLYPTRDAHAV